MPTTQARDIDIAGQNQPAVPLGTFSSPAGISSVRIKILEAVGAVGAGRPAIHVQSGAGEGERRGRREGISTGRKERKAKTMRQGEQRRGRMGEGQGVIDVKTSTMQDRR